MVLFEKKKNNFSQFLSTPQKSVSGYVPDMTNMTKNNMFAKRNRFIFSRLTLIKNWAPWPKFSVKLPRVGFNLVNLGFHNKGVGIFTIQYATENEHTFF